MYPNSYASVVLEDLFGSRKELIDLDSTGKLLPFLSPDLCFNNFKVVVLRNDMPCSLSTVP